MEAKIRRQQALQDARAVLVLSAAREVIARVGLEGASIREIARAAGYTPGALYAYFSNKHALLIALLEESLTRLAQAVAQAKSPKGRPQALLLSQGEAWFGWLSTHPQDLALVLYFLGGRSSQVLDQDSASRVHQAIRGSLQPLATELLALGMAPEQVQAEMETVLAQGAGLLMAQDPTRRPAPHLMPQSLFGAHLRRLLQVLNAEAGASAGEPEVAQSAQVDLFN